MVMHLKQSTVKSMLTVARRGKTKFTLDPDGLSLLTALINLLTQETFARAAQVSANTGNRVVSNVHLKRIIAQIMLDFSA